MVITHDGKVGIGETDPASQLEVKGSAATEITITRGDNNKPAGAVKFAGASGSDFWQIGCNRIIGNVFELNYQSSNKLQISEAGAATFAGTINSGAITSTLSLIHI